MGTLGRVVRNLEMAAGLFLSSDVVMTPAMAALITYDFTGEVTKVDPQLASQFHPSQHRSVFMTVNTMNINPAPNIEPSPSLGIYDIQNSHITIGTYTATMGVGEVVASPGLFKANELVATGNTVDSLAPERFIMFLSGPSTSNLFMSNDALVIPPPSVASFPSGSGQFVLGFGKESAVSGTVTSLTAVPLPAAGLLFGGGLVALRLNQVLGPEGGYRSIRMRKEIRTTRPCFSMGRKSLWYSHRKFPDSTLVLPSIERRTTSALSSHFGSS